MDIQKLFARIGYNTDFCFYGHVMMFRYLLKKYNFLFSFLFCAKLSPHIRDDVLKKVVSHSEEKSQNTKATTPNESVEEKENRYKVAEIQLHLTINQIAISKEVQKQGNFVIVCHYGL